MKIYNNNLAFGDGGPFEIDAPTFRLACHELANEMEPSFRIWASEKYGSEFYAKVNAGKSVRHLIDPMRREFLEGLTEVRRCAACGQDYHVDAPERGHAAGCDRFGC